MSALARQIGKSVLARGAARATVLAMALVGGVARGQEVAPAGETGAAPASGAPQRVPETEDDVFASRGPVLRSSARSLEHGGSGSIGWGLLGLAGASAITTLGAVIYREVHAQRWNDAGRCLEPGLTRAEACGSELAAARAGECVALVGGSLTAILTLGVLLHAMVSSDTPTTRAPSSARLGCGLGAGALGVSCDGSF